MRKALSFLAFFLVLTGIAHAENTVPDRRVILWRNVDFYGSDLQSIFDTDMRACENACLANTSCTAFTFNSRSNSCFLKEGVTDQQEYEGAFSARVFATDPQILGVTGTREAELSFLSAADFSNAHQQGMDLPHDFVVGGWDIDNLLTGMREAEAAANLVSAMRYAAGVAVQTDTAADWLEFARLSLAIRTSNSSDQRKYSNQGVNAAINTYLRSGNPAQQATALVHLATGLEAIGRGRDTIPALRQAQLLSPRDDISAALDRAIAQFGFRITDNRVDSDSAEPRLCATFSEPLVRAGVDYTPYVQADISGLAVEVAGRDLCVTGVDHGERYRLTLRAGLPAASGEELVKPVTLNLYVRDRSPSVHFPGRAYVLPAAADAGLPIVGVNAAEVDLTLFRISDRNMVRAFQDRYFAHPLSPWELDSFETSVGSEIWQGKGTLQTDLNQEITTNLPIGEAIAGQPPGIYALQAAVPGVDPYDNPPAIQWFVISDIGIATMLGADGLHVFTRSLASAEAMVGAEVELVSRSNTVLGKVPTNERGYARFSDGLTAGFGGMEPALVVVRNGDDIAFLSLTEPEFDLSDRGVEGRPPAPPIDLFASTDRGAYRAGEVIHATVLARDGKAEAIESLPITAVLTRPDGVEYSRVLSRGEGAGGHVFDLPLGGGVPRGTWRLDFHADPDAPALVSETLLVEDFLPERIDFDLALPDGAMRLTDRPNLTVNARYLFGAPGADLPIEGDVVLRPARSVDGWPGYDFGHYDTQLSAAWGSLPYDRRTNAAGNAVLPVELPEIEAPGTPLEATISVRVSEGSGRPVERSITRLMTPDSSLIGIKPGFEDDIPEGSEAPFQVIALGPDLAPMEMQARWTLNRVSTRYQWYSLNGRWNWDPVTTRTPVATGDLTLGQSPVAVSALVDWGHYELVVESTGADAGIASAVEFWAGWYGVADASTTPDMLDVSLDKASYRPGETAVFRMVPRVSGKVLVAVVSNRLIDMVAVDVTQGEHTVQLPVTEDWGAGAYVTATLIQPMDTATGRNPTRALGLAHALVDPGAHHLAATLEVADEVNPRGPLDVAVRVDGVQAGDTVFATIAAVDVGILNLTSFDSPDPSGHYFGQRRLGMGIRDLYGRLIDGSDGVMGAIRSGGDAGAELRMQAPPPTEELVAQFSGILTVGDDGYARTTFTLPEFNGTVRLMAVVWSQTGVGEAEADILVRDPVVMTASLPRFMAPGDTARLLLELVHAKGPAGDVSVEIIADGIAVGTLGVPDRIALAEQGTARLQLPVTAKDAGVHQISLALTTPGGDILTKTLMLPVQANDPEVARVSRFNLAAGDGFTLDQAVFTDLIPGTGRATLTAGPLARFNAPALLERLDRYPYGCTEQLASRALPLLYFGTVAEAMGLTADADIPARVADAVEGVLSNQSAAGSFGLWRPSSGDLWLDAYVSDFLSRARAQGYDVPDTAFRAAMDNLRNRVNYAPDFDQGGQAIAYALYVLAREGAASMGDLRYFADEKGDAFATPLAAAQLGAALAAYGDTRRADAMFVHAARKLARLQPDSSQIWRDDYGTNLRDAAAVLTLATESGSDVVNRDALATRVARGDDYLSTQEATWSLLAANALIGEGAVSGLTVNGEALSGPLIEVLDAGMALGGANIVNGGSDTAELTLTTFGVPATPEPAGGQGYTIERRYFTTDGEPVDAASVAQGTRLVTVLTVQPHGSSEGRLIVNDPLPAGFEIDNPNLLKAGDVKALDWLDLNVRAETAEFRQERFLAAVDWRSDKPFRLAYIVRAVTPGVFHHPAASVEDMYRPAFRARGETGEVTVVE